MAGQDSKEKSKLTLSLNKDVIKRAKAAGINISEITEKLLTAVTLTPSGNTWDDVVEAYMALFESIKKILGKYNAHVTVVSSSEDNTAIILNERGFFTAIVDSESISLKEPHDDLPTIMYYLDIPEFPELLDKIIRALIEAAERNKEEIARLQFALKLFKTLSEDEKDDKN
jgi:post-segregation antitoxin (ccd killing protein)